MRFTVFEFIDSLLIAPYRLLGNPIAGFYGGTLVLAILCLLLGRLSYDLVWLFNRSHYDKEETEMTRMHNLSVAAIESGDKTAYKAANREANEAFGKSFFAGAALFSVSIWPLPFALAWLSIRFDGVDIPLWPGHGVRYNAIFLGLYLIARLSMWRFWSRLPFFGRVMAKRREAAEKRPKLRPWTELGKPGA